SRPSPCRPASTRRSAATTRAGAAPARSSRSVTGRRRWPTNGSSRSRSSSKGSEPSWTGFVVTFDVASLTARIAELEEELAQPDFRTDQQRAAKVSAEHTRGQRKLDRYAQLQSNYAFLEEGAGTFPEEELLPVLHETQQELAQLQEDALFSGEYDAGDAVVTIQADAGGTDAQDWAEILLRMYLRWAERRGFETEILETSPGEEYG